MNLAELSQLDIKDLKSINIKKLGADILQNPGQLVALLIVVGSVIFCVHYYLQKKTSLRFIDLEVSSLMKTKSVLEEYKAAKKEYENLSHNLPKGLPENELANALTDLAIRRGVQIESFSPAKKIKKDTYDLSSVNLEISSTEYDKIFLFVYDIENSFGGLRVDSLSIATADINPIEPRSKEPAVDPNAEVGPKITVTLEIASILFDLYNEDT